MTTVVVGEIKNRVGFEIDRRSWRHLKLFQSKLAQLKGQMEGLSGGLTLGGGSRGGSSSGGSRGGYSRGSRSGYSDSVKYHIDAFMHSQKMIERAKNKFYSQTVQEQVFGNQSGKSARDSANVFKEAFRAEESERRKSETRRIRIDKAKSRHQELTSAFPKASRESVKEYTERLKDLNSQYRKGKMDVREYNNLVAQQERAFTRNARSVKTLNERFLEMRHNMLGLGIAGSAVIAGRSTGSVGMQFESMSAKMLMATGSLQSAKEQMAFARSEANRLGHNVLTTSNAFSKLSIATSGTLSKGQTQELFTGLMEMGTASKLTQDEMHRAINAIQQMSSKGQIMAEELKSQFAEAVPGGIQIFADALGMSKKELFAQMEAGNLLAGDVLPKVAKQLRIVANTGGSLEEALKSPAIQLAKMQNALLDLQDAFYQSGFNDLIKAGANLFDDLFTAAKPLAQFLGNTLGKSLTIASAPLRFLVAAIADLVEYFDLAKNPEGFTSSLLAIAAGFLMAGKTIQMMWKFVTGGYGVMKKLGSVGRLAGKDIDDAIAAASTVIGGSSKVAGTAGTVAKTSASTASGLIIPELAKRRLEKDAASSVGKAAGAAGGGLKDAVKIGFLTKLKDIGPWLMRGIRAAGMFTWVGLAITALELLVTNWDSVANWFINIKNKLFPSASTSESFTKKPLPVEPIWQRNSSNQELVLKVKTDDSVFARAISVEVDRTINTAVKEIYIND